MQVDLCSCSIFRYLVIIVDASGQTYPRYCGALYAHWLWIRKGKISKGTDVGLLFRRESCWAQLGRWLLHRISFWVMIILHSLFWTGKTVNNFFKASSYNIKAHRVKAIFLGNSALWSLFPVIRLPCIQILQTSSPVKICTSHHCYASSEGGTSLYSCWKLCDAREVITYSSFCVVCVGQNYLKWAHSVIQRKYLNLPTVVSYATIPWRICWSFIVHAQQKPQFWPLRWKIHPNMVWLSCREMERLIALWRNQRYADTFLWNGLCVTMILWD